MSFVFQGSKVTLARMPGFSSPMPLKILTAFVKDVGQSVSLSQMLVKFDSLFQEPKGLPPERQFDRRIILHQILLPW